MKLPLILLFVHNISVLKSLENSTDIEKKHERRLLFNMPAHFQSCCVSITCPAKKCEEMQISRHITNLRRRLAERCEKLNSFRSPIEHNASELLHDVKVPAVNEIAPTIKREYSLQKIRTSTLCSNVWLEFLDNGIPRKDENNIYSSSSSDLVIVQEHRHIYEEHVCSMSPALPAYLMENEPQNVHSIFSQNIRNFKRIRNLHQLVIKAGLNIDDFFVTKSTQTNGETKIGGFVYKVWKTLEERLNFTTEWLGSMEKAWGVLLENGTWTGVVGMLHRNEVDVGVGAFSITTTRSKAVDFFTPLMAARSSVYFRTPDTAGSASNTYTKPFTFGVWLAVLFCMLTFTIFIFALKRIEQQPRDKEKDTPLFFQICDILFHIFSSFCQQGESRPPRSLSCQIVYMTCYLTALMVTACYSASLVSYLTVNDISLPFNNLEEFLKDGTYKFEVGRHNFEMNYFSESNDSVDQEVYRRFLEPNLETMPNGTVEGMERVCNNQKYAYMDYLQPPNVKNVTCKIQELPGFHLPCSFSMIIRKKSPLLKIINYQLEEMRREGILKRLYNFHIGIGETQDDNSWTRTCFQDVIPVLTLLGVGVLVSVTILALERRFFSFNARLISQKEKVGSQVSQRKEKKHALSKPSAQ